MQPAKSYRLLSGSTRKILFLLLLVVLVPVLLVQASIYYTWFRERRAQQDEANLEVARAAAVAFDSYIDDVRHIEFALGRSLITPPPSSTQEMNLLLSDSAAKYRAILSFCWISAQGTVIASSIPAEVGTHVGDRPCFRNTFTKPGGWFISNVTHSPDHKDEFFTFSQVIRDHGGSVRGLIATKIMPAMLASELRVRRAPGGAILIVDSSGWLVYRDPPLSIEWSQRNWGQKYPIIKKALAGQEATGIVTSTFDKKRRMVAVAPIRHIGWAVGTGEPEATVLAPLRRSLLADFAALFFVSGLAVLIAVVLIRNVHRPIKALEEHADAIERGELEHRADVSGISELEELADITNRMTNVLRMREQEHERVLELERAQTRDVAVLSNIQQNIDIHLAYLAPDLTIVYANDVVSRNFSFPRDKAIGKKLSEVWRDPMINEVFEQVARTGEPIRFREMPYEFTKYIVPGVTYWDWSVTPIKNAQGELEGLVVSALDVTEKFHAREQLLEAERSRTQLAETMAAEISHRMKNNLAAASGILQLQLAQHPPGSPIAEAIGEAVSRLRALSIIHEQLSETRSQKIDLLDALHRIADIDRQTLPKEDVSLSVAVDPVHISSKPASAIMVIVNELITNALKYGAPGPTGKLQIDVTISRRDGSLALTVWNSGNPVPPDLDLTGQSGLGLRLAYELSVNQLNGTLTLRPHQDGTLAELLIDESTLS